MFAPVSSLNWFSPVSALANVQSCVEHKLVLPCVGSSLMFARVSSINWFCRVSALVKCSLVCRALNYGWLPWVGST